MSQNNQYNTIEEAERLFWLQMIRTERTKGIWYVQQSLQHRRISILWRLMRKGLSVHR